MYYLSIVLVILAIISGRMVLHQIPTLKLRNEGTQLIPSFSIIIPARNEADNLPQLLNSLQKQSIVPPDIIVVDDDSTDETARIARDYGAKVVNLKDSPLSWVGKSAGCYAGALAATGESLFFLDADTTFPDEHSLYTILVNYEAQQSQGVLSIQPFHTIKKPYENLSAVFNILVLAGMNRFSILQNHIESPGAFGPSLLVNRTEYFKIGGHKKVKGSIMENIALGKVFLEEGRDVSLFGGEGVLHFRMYPDGLKDLFQGWGKSFASGSTSTHKVILGAIGFWIAGSLLSFSLLLFSFFISQPFIQLLALVCYFLYGFQFYNMAKKVGAFSPSIIFLFPIHFLFFIGTFVYSVIRTFFIGSVSWKGRKVEL